MKVLSVVGARPQFVKAAAVSRVLRGDLGRELGLSEYLVHTGQHYDHGMSAVFFEELHIPRPDIDLGVGSGPHGAMTGRMLAAIEEVLLRERPGVVLVYGDTNSTLAAALAAAKVNIPVAHVEAGLRSFNRRMPEEVNRVVTDHVSSLLFCPTGTAADNLSREGITHGVELVGDVMYDASLYYRELAAGVSRRREELGLVPGGFALATVHRQENTDDASRLGSILRGLGRLAEDLPVVFPLHPRTRHAVASHGLEPLLNSLLVVEPLGYLDMVVLEQEAALIVTDSGGVQKEAFFYGVPCVTLRDETEWVETVNLGWNRLVGADEERIAASADFALSQGEHRPLTERFEESGEIAARPRPEVYGDGHAAEKIVQLLSKAG